jgi:hypothetical protein
MLYIIPRGCWCDIFLTLHVPTKDTSDDTKDSFYEELEHIFDQLHKDHMKILLGEEKIFSK